MLHAIVIWRLISGEILFSISQPAWNSMFQSGGHLPIISVYVIKRPNSTKLQRCQQNRIRRPSFIRVHLVYPWPIDVYIRELPFGVYSAEIVFLDGPVPILLT